MKQTIRALLRRAGFEVTRYPPRGRGRDPFVDMSFFLQGLMRPVIFDVGANVGQSVDRFKKTFPGLLIHSFEPSPGTFEKLRARCAGLDGVTTWNCGVGSRHATLPFMESDHSDMSSFLAPGELCWGTVEKVTDVEVLTLDAFADQHGVEYIHILKSDTQGYDFEVFKGADELMKQDRIGLIYFEFTFSDMYKGLPSFADVYQFLSERNFRLVSFYEANFQQDLLGWTDVMFINGEFNRRRG